MSFPPNWRYDKQAPGTGRFRDFLLKQNRRLLGGILAASVALFTIFKLLYPYPAFYWDSFSYLYAAYQHLDVEIWPIGYSWILAAFHAITPSDTAFVAFQYLVYLCSALYFYFTLLWFYPTSRLIRILLLVFFFANPLFVFFSNYIGSDNLFMSLSLVWFTQLIWILRRPNPSQIAVHALTILILFIIRYNAMIYPLISAGAFLLSKQPVRYKILGIIAGPLIIIPFIAFSSNAAKELTGTAQFPPIVGGWQWGNNALYMREYIEVDSTMLPTPEARELDEMARVFFQRTAPYNRDLPSIPANFFMIASYAPLWQYLLKHYPQKDLHDYHNFSDFITSYGKVAPVFDQYGKHLIRQHPFLFLRYFAGVNLPKYFIPPLEAFARYNNGLDTVNTMAKVWFHYPTTRVSSVSKTVQGLFFRPLPFVFLLLNLFFAAYSVLAFGKTNRSGDKAFRHTLLLAALFLALNFAFSVTAAIIIMRYQMVPLVVLVVMDLLLIDRMVIPSKQEATAALQEAGMLETMG